MAPPGWRSVDFISDLHLQAEDPATFAAWQRYMRATPADAIFILGDLFEVWIGDDAALEPGFAADCADVLADAAQRVPVYFLHGNRDFLVGRALLDGAVVQMLEDPAVLVFAGQRWLLTHGDALCLEDTNYLKFRDEVRDPAWQQAFLARPLAERRAIAQGLRNRSKVEATVYADVDAPAALAWLRAAEAPVMIHGHTHRPAEHALDDSHRRIVLSDWHADTQPPRLEALRISADARLERVALA